MLLLAIFLGDGVNKSEGSFVSLGLFSVNLEGDLLLCGDFCS